MLSVASVTSQDISGVGVGGKQVHGTTLEEGHEEKRQSRRQVYRPRPMLSIVCRVPSTVAARSFCVESWVPWCSRMLLLIVCEWSRTAGFHCGRTIVPQ